MGGMWASMRSRCMRGSCAACALTLCPPPPSPPPTPPSPHAQSFRMRIGSTRKALKSRATFVFADATFAAGEVLSEAQVAEFGGTAQGRTWFRWRDAAPGQRPSQSTE